MDWLGDYEKQLLRHTPTYPLYIAAVDATPIDIHAVMDFYGFNDERQVTYEYVAGIKAHYRDRDIYEELVTHYTD